ncbi:MAG: leucine-rich repeat domain-containing protein [Eubacterium sp.]
MKKISKAFVIVFLLALTVTLVSVTNTQAATKKTKKKVTYELKKGTLTIRGKGRMPDSMRFKNNKKIKKVVIKKGITYISKYAFSGCKNLKTVTIPKTVKTIGWHSFENTSIKKITIPTSVKTIGNEAFVGCKKLKNITIPGKFKVKVKAGDGEWCGIMSKVKNVTFNTKLSVKNVSYCYADNLYVSKKDTKYKSIKGVIYSKDGKKIVRVPSGRKELVIENGCTDFCLQSILYGYYLNDDRDVALCRELVKVTIPETVERIDNTSYRTSYDNVDEMAIDEFVIKTKKLDSKSIVTLVDTFDYMYNFYPDEKKNLISIEEIAKQLPEKIKVVNNMYITDDGVLIRYIGNDQEVIIPSNVKEIAPRAFRNRRYYTNEKSKLEKVVIPESVQTIGEEAFAMCDKLTDVTLPKSLKYIGKDAFYMCKNENIKIPAGVITI